MALNNVTFIKGQGGLGRPLAGKDFISSLLFYSDTLPGGFNSTHRIKEIFSVSQAEDLGIKADYNDETRAIGDFLITNAGANGDKITLKFTEPNGTDIVLGSYVKVSTDSNVTAVATALAAAINARTITTGYSCISSGGDILITVRKGLGLYPNGKNFTAVKTGDIAGSMDGTISGGVDSIQSLWHYHISEYFRIQPKGDLYLGFYPTSDIELFTAIQTIQEFANGNVRQMGVFTDAIYNSSNVTAIQSICDILDAEKKPLSVLLAEELTDYGSIGNLDDLQSFTGNKVSVIIGQDAGGLGFEIFSSRNKSVTCLGATLGAVSVSAVNEDIAWVGKFNMSNGTELEKIGFGTGETTVSASLLDATNLKRYIFLRKFPNLAGSYFNDNHCAISQSSDYAYINDNRVIDKAIRGVDQALLPSLNSPLLLNANGTLANETVVSLEGKATVITDDMVRNSEVSAVSVTIDPTQNVLATNEVVITINIVPVGVARNIVVNIGYKTSL